MVTHRRKKQRLADAEMALAAIGVAISALTVLVQMPSPVVLQAFQKQITQLLADAMKAVLARHATKN